MSNQIARNSISRYIEKREQEYVLGSQTITTAVVTNINWDLAVGDQLNNVLINNGNGIFTVIKEGLFNVEAQIAWAHVPAGATGLRKVYLERNQDGKQLMAQSQNAVTSITLKTLQATSGTFRLVTGDNIEVYVQHTQGANLDVLGTAGINEQSILRISYTQEN